jgi:hypothetical protein
MLLYANHTNPTQPLSKYTKTHATSSLVQSILSIVTFSTQYFYRPLSGHISHIARIVTSYRSIRHK